MITVRIPPTLRTEVGGARQVEATGDSVREVIDDLVERHPALGPQILADGGIAPFVNVYLGGEDVRTLDGLDTPVAPGATVILLPAMAGGAPVPPPDGAAPAGSARRRGVTEFGRNVRNNVGDQPVRIRITWRKVRLTGIG